MEEDLKNRLAERKMPKEVDLASEAGKAKDATDQLIELLDEHNPLEDGELDWGRPVGEEDWY